MASLESIYAQHPLLAFQANLPPSLSLLILALVHFFSPMFWKSVEQVKQKFLDFHSSNPSYSAQPLHVGNTHSSLKVNKHAVA